jgi:AraC-like DNA-binding protein
MRRHKDRDESRRFHHAAMSDDHIPPTSSKPLDEARRRYLDAVPPLHPEWPPDMQVVFRETMRRLLDEGVTAKEIVEDCGFRSHDIYSRFRYEVGPGIKGLIVEFRMRLAKQLLREYEDASITDVALYGGVWQPQRILDDVQTARGLYTDRISEARGREKGRL